MKIRVLCPDSNEPAGGVKILYSLVDVLNRHGFQASVMHGRKGFRCTWFENETAVEYVPDAVLDSSDLWVIPEIYGLKIPEVSMGSRRVIFNQNAYYTFIDQGLLGSEGPSPYLDKDTVAVIAVSEDNREYLEYAFPGLRVRRIHYPFDPEIFRYNTNKRPRIAFMPRKNPDDIRQVMNILLNRGALEGFELVPIDAKNEHEVARILEDSLLFLSFGHPEGCSMPPLEAMSCGCVVLGYHGMGGREYFKPEFSYPVVYGDIVGYAETVEQVLEIYREDPGAIQERGRLASAYVLENHHPGRFSSEVVDLFGELCAGGRREPVERERGPAPVRAAVRSAAPRRAEVPIVIPVFHREAETRRMLTQLAKVTDNYSLVIVNNGFDDPEFLIRQNPLGYIENAENVGVIRAVNQGLERVEGEYAAVLHNDLLIYEEGWLDHIVAFMERRPDVGLVGLAGRHSVGGDGTLDFESTVANIRGYPKYLKPTWRMTEVASIDGLGWVMRMVDLRLDEGFGLMHAYDVDLSLQYMEAGYRVYAAAVEIEHLAEDPKMSTRSMDEYLSRIGGDDAASYRRAIEMLKEKWEHLLPISRGFRDESYAYSRIDHLIGMVEELELWARSLETENEALKKEVARAASHIEHVETELGLKDAAIETLDAQMRDKRAEIAEKDRAIEMLSSGGREGISGEGTNASVATRKRLSFETAVKSLRRSASRVLRRGVKR